MKLKNILICGLFMTVSYSTLSFAGYLEFQNVTSHPIIIKSDWSTCIGKSTAWGTHTLKPYTTSKKYSVDYRNDGICGISQTAKLNFLIYANLGKNGVRGLGWIQYRDHYVLAKGGVDGIALHLKNSNDGATYSKDGGELMGFSVISTK